MLSCKVLAYGMTECGLVYAVDTTQKQCGTTRKTLDLEAIRKEVNTYLPSCCQLSMFEKTPKRRIHRFLYW